MEEHTKNNKGFIKGALFGALTVLLVVGIVFGVRQVYNRVTNQIYSSEAVVTSKTEKKLERLKALIDKYYLRDVKESALEDGIYEGYLSGLGDPYSAYYNKKDTKKLNESTSGEYSGIGAVLTEDANSGIITIKKVYKNSPAEKAGMKDEDILYKVEGEEVTGQDLTSVVSKIRGEKGTKLKLTVLRGEQNKEYNLIPVRDVITAEAVEYEMKGDVAYVSISEFTTGSAEQFEKALDEVKKKGAEGMVLDLRGNPGGSVSAVCKIADLLLPQGTVVSTKDKEGNKDQYTSSAENSFGKPMAVLVNSGSASASEILSGALKDYKVATIVGTQTYGKGVIQQVLDLGDGTSVKITVAEYFTPKGTKIQGKGVTPDVKLEYKLPENGSKEDNQLDKALDIVKKEIAK